MKDTEFMVEKIRSQYTEREHTELDDLKALDAKVKNLPTCLAIPMAAPVPSLWVQV